MAIQLHSLRPVTLPAKTVKSAQTHAVVLTAKTSVVQSKPAAAKARAPEVASDFRSVLTGGLAASGAASAAARSAATAASASAIAAAVQSTAAKSAASATTATSHAAAATTDPNAAPTAQQVFGANPWVTNPTGIGPTGVTFGYNPLYFATADTAAEVAQMLGGTVVQDNEFTKDTPGDPFAQQQPNEMVELPDGALINPGIIASLYTHGYPQSQVEQAISSEVASAEALVTTTRT
jgi:hypothetical protein